MADRRPINALAGPSMQATPRKNALAGYAADALGAVDQFARKPFGYDNPPAALASDFLSVPAIQRTLERLSYGEPLTTGRGLTTRMRPDTVDAAMAVAPAVAKWPKQALGAAGALVGADASALGGKAMVGALPRNNMSADYLKNLVSSQRYIDRDVIAKKIKARDFTVKITPAFELDGETVHAIEDGHHALEAAIRSGNRPKFVIQNASQNDRIGAIDSGNIDDYLEQAYVDSPWYNFSTKRDIF